MYDRKNSLKTALANTEKERQMFNALCINYTSAYYCDLKTDYMESIKRKDFSHSAMQSSHIHNPHSFSEWNHYVYDHRLEAGMNYHLAKPLNMEELTKVLAQLCRQS